MEDVHIWDVRDVSIFDAGYADKTWMIIIRNLFVYGEKDR